jgi:hypothetical protein
MVLYWILLSSFVCGACNPPIFGGRLAMGCSEEPSRDGYGHLDTPTSHDDACSRGKTSDGWRAGGR